MNRHREILERLERLEEGQRKILEKLEKGEPAGREDQWLQDGIDSIMSYQAGGKRKHETE